MVTAIAIIPQPGAAPNILHAILPMPNPIHSRLLRLFTPFSSSSNLAVNKDSAIATRAIEKAVGKIATRHSVVNTPEIFVNNCPKCSKLNETEPMLPTFSTLLPDANVYVVIKISVTREEGTLFRKNTRFFRRGNK